MLQFIEKDLRTQKVWLFVLHLLMLIFLPLSVSYNSFTDTESSIRFGLGVSLVAYVAEVQSLFATNEEGRLHHRLLLSLPLARRTIVRSQYMTALLWWAYSYLLGGLCLSIVGLILLPWPWPWPYVFSPWMLLLSLSVDLLLIGVSYPWYYRFGYRLLQILSFGLLFVMIMGTGMIVYVFADQLTQFILVLTGIAIIVGAGSYALSAHIFGRKDL